MSKNKQNLEDKVEQLKKELKDAEEQLKNYDNMSPVHQLAVDLHELFCNQNHTDGCGWYYEFERKLHKWDGYSHASYLKKAQALLKKANELKISREQVLEVVSIMEK